jgi:hypothetical protein
MSDRSSIYAADPRDFSEVERAIRICLAGMPLPDALSFPGGDFPAWAAGDFCARIVPHALQARELVLRGESALLVRMDAALLLPVASSLAGAALLARREGARHLPATRRFAAAVAGGTAPGHFATVIALQSAEFSVALLPLLQCLLYCEWCTAQQSHSSRALSNFFRLAGPELAALPALVSPHAQETAIPRLSAVR